MSAWKVLMGAWKVFVNEWRILLSVVGSFGECVENLVSA